MDKKLNAGAVIGIKIAVLAIIALVSFFVVADYASSPEVHAETIEALDEKRSTVMELTAASTATSVAITMIPGDAATPIAEQLAELSSTFLVVLCAIYLEKYLVTVTGYATFKILIPAACLLLIVDTFWQNHTLKCLAGKLAAFGIAITLVIPASVTVSNLIETTYESSIQETIDLAMETTEEIESSAETEEKEQQGILAGLISKVEETVSGATDKVETVLNNFIEALAVMLVTSCVIPILVLVFFVWFVKILLGVDIENTFAH